MTDTELAQFAATIPRDVREAMLDLWKRLPEEAWSDIRALLLMAEARRLPGHLALELHHDAAGNVGKVHYEPDWNRQAKRRTA